MKRRSKWSSLLILLSAVTLCSCGKAKQPENTESTAPTPVVAATPAPKEYPYEKKASYMIYYGVLNQDIINEAKQYEIFILHPKMGDVTREQVQEIRESGTIVLGYLTIGEDLRTAGMTPEQMLADGRFSGDESGPRVDPRKAGDSSLHDVDIKGKPSPAGTGFASYFLDDNDHDGTPDFNPYFTCAYVNIGDPAWYEELEQMTIDGYDKIPGIKEILTDDYGRGLGCDGLFLDTIDTCAPNSYTGDNDPGKTRFEWTAPGVAEFTSHLKKDYPDKLILQNRGLFFYNPQLPHYEYTPRTYVDYVMFESYTLDSNTTTLYSESFHADNKYNFAPKLIAEASRPDGFQVLSLGYAEGPAEYQLKETLLENSTVGLDVLMDDLNQAWEEVGFLHYITDGNVTLVNDFGSHHESLDDNVAPTWSSTYNDSNTWPPHEPTPRVGVQEAEAIQDGVIVRWDVAFDKNPITYVLYYQTTPFDFENDPTLSSATSLELVPEVGEGYENGTGPSVYPFQATVTGLDSNVKYYFVIRARDASDLHNEDQNEVTIMATPK